MGTRGSLVSLLMPVWRPHDGWLEVAVRSALDQNGVELELLLIDDGNPEPVAERLAHISDPRLRIERVPHGGVAAGRNAAIRLARGDYVRFLDCDDAFPPDGTALLLELAEGRQDVLAYGATLVCDTQLQPLWRMRAKQRGDAVVDSLLARFNVRPGGLLWPRELLQRTGEFDPTMVNSSDWEYIQRALEFADVRGTDTVVHLYRRHATALTTNIESGRASAREIVRRYFDRHPDQRGTRLERRALAMLDATSARAYATHGQPKEAVRHLMRGLAQDPLCLADEFVQARSALLGTIERRLRGRRSAGDV